MARLVSERPSAAVLTAGGGRALASVRRSGGLLAAVIAAAGVGLIPLWWHWTVVDSGSHGIIAVFTEVGVYPSDICVAVLALPVLARAGALHAASRWIAAGLTALAAAALASARWAIDPTLTCAVAGQLATLGLAWLSLRAVHAPRVAIVAALVGSAVVESGLAAAQFVVQQPLVPPELVVPGSTGAAPVR